MDEPRNRETAVKNLQRYLRSLSGVYPEIKPIPIDGIFASATQDALMQFQIRFRLPPTGVADRDTWNALYAEYQKICKKECPEKGLRIFPSIPDKAVVVPGENSMFVRIMQMILNELTAFYSYDSIASCNGQFDTATEEAVREIQRTAMLPVTGCVDLQTWNTIVNAYSNYSAE